MNCLYIYYINKRNNSIICFVLVVYKNYEKGDLMKKLLILMLTIILMFSFVACKDSGKDPKSTKEPDKTQAPEKKELEGKLEDLIEQINEGANSELPELVNTEVDEANSKYYTGVEKLNFTEALANEPAINPGAHSVVLIRMPEGTDIEKTKQEILEGADPRKWVCVGVEKVIVNNAGNLIVLIMSNDADKYHDSFLAIAGDLAGEPISKLNQEG